MTTFCHRRHHTHTPPRLSPRNGPPHWRLASTSWGESLHTKNYNSRNHTLTSQSNFISNAIRQSDIRRRQRGVYLQQPPIKEEIGQVSLPREEWTVRNPESIPPGSRQIDQSAPLLGQLGGLFPCPSHRGASLELQARACNTLALRAVARSATHRHRTRRPAP